MRAWSTLRDVRICILSHQDVYFAPSAFTARLVVARPIGLRLVSGRKKPSYSSRLPFTDHCTLGRGVDFLLRSGTWSKFCGEATGWWVWLVPFAKCCSTHGWFQLQVVVGNWPCDILIYCWYLWLNVNHRDVLLQPFSDLNRVNERCDSLHFIPWQYREARVFG